MNNWYKVSNGFRNRWAPRKGNVGQIITSTQYGAYSGGNNFQLNSDLR